MKIEDIIRILKDKDSPHDGKMEKAELKDVEFKVSLPQSSEKYVKTIIAYANTQGGHLIVGVENETREVVGIDEGDLFKAMDAIANAVSDTCEPQIIPEIEPYTIEGKTVIIVSVAPEPNRPYFIKSKGKEKGTYIRVGATTRLASSEKIKELEMEGARISWDELQCVGYEVTDQAIRKLCRDMNSRRKEIQERGTVAKKLPAVTRTNLENWKVLKRTNDGYLASNAFVLLTSDFFPFSKTQCAVFKGSSRSVFLDKRDFTGPIYKQIEEAENFVLRNIRLGVKIDGLIRKESYELPLDAIREMIVNAHCHRLLTDESCVQVAVFDNRLEVTSPGGLYNGLTFEEALQGHSKLRNRVIANVFSQIGLIEAWGTGLQRIRDAAAEYGLPAPEFIEMPESFRVNLYRKPYVDGESESLINVGEMSENVGEMSENDGDNSGKTTENECELQEKMIRLISSNRTISASGMADALGITQRTVERYIKKMREEGMIIRHGAARGGYWEVVKVR